MEQQGGFDMGQQGGFNIRYWSPEHLSIQVAYALLPAGGYLAALAHAGASMSDDIQEVKCALAEAEAWAERLAYALNAAMLAHWHSDAHDRAASCMAASGRCSSRMVIALTLRRPVPPDAGWRPPS